MKKKIINYLERFQHLLHLTYSKSDLSKQSCIHVVSQIPFKQGSKVYQKSLVVFEKLAALAFSALCQSQISVLIFTVKDTIQKRKMFPEFFTLGCELYSNKHFKHSAREHLKLPGYLFSNKHLKICFDLPEQQQDPVAKNTEALVAHRQLGL